MEKLMEISKPRTPLWDLKTTHPETIPKDFQKKFIAIYI